MVILNIQTSKAVTGDEDPSALSKEQFNAVVATNPPPSILANANVASNVSTPTYQNYPHIGLYGILASSGWPLVGLPGSSSASASDPLNSALMDLYAKSQRVILPAMPPADLRPDILTGLRTRNPDISLIAYTMGYTTWCSGDSNGNNSYPVGSYYRSYYLAVTGGDPSCTSSTNRFLWMQDGIRADE